MGRIRRAVEGDATIYIGDALDVLRGMPDGSVDLVFCSPPYENARLNDGHSTLVGQAWVDWATPIYLQCARVCKGLVAWVVEGRTRQFRWSATPVLLMADLHRAGVKLRKPPAFKRVGIPGSGGPDWLRNDYEFIVCSSHGRLPWSSNTAMGHPPKWAPGGEMSHRVANGARVNQWGHSINSGATVVRGDGSVRSRGTRPSHFTADRLHTKRRGDGRMELQGYSVPVRANPGNVVEVIVGGGVMGDPLCHETEAPFPERLAEFFIRSFCPPGGVVLDCYSGSGTTLAVALQHGRRAVGVDIRESQGQLTLRRVRKVLGVPNQSE